MSYIGQGLPADTFQGFTTDSFTGDGSATTFTLSKEPFSEDTLIVVINNVIQQPTTNFTVSGTTLTIVGTAVANGDPIYAIHMGGPLPIGGASELDLNGASDKLILDADADTTISADTDDQIDVKIGGTDALRVTGTALTGNAVATIGASGTALSLAGITFYQGQSGSIYTADVSGTDNDAENNTAYGASAMDAITTGDNNVAIGEHALGALNTGADNVAIGYNAGSSGTSASYNTMIGRNAGAATSASSAITAVGYYAGAANTSATQNTFVGFNAGAGCVGGGYNTAIGHNALRQPDAETNNVAIGRLAMEGAVAGGEYNTCVGNNTLDALTSGDSNTALGYNAGTAVTTGSENVLVGQEAGIALTEGGNNVCVGEYTANNLTTGDYNTTLGNNNTTDGVDAQHQITIGYGIGSNGDNNFTFGKAGNRVYNNFSSNASWTRSSDERKKQNIKDDNLGLDFINELRPVTFQWKPSNEFPKEWDEYNEENQMDTDTVMHGLIAQEVKSALDKAGIDTFGGWEQSKDGMQNISREMFVFPLIKAVQELSAKVKKLESK